MKTFTMADLLARCAERQQDAEQERDDAKRYAAWMRSPEGQATSEEWHGDPESVDEDAEFFDEEARFFAALIRQLRPIGRRQRLLVEGSNH